MSKGVERSKNVTATAFPSEFHRNNGVKQFVLMSLNMAYFKAILDTFHYQTSCSHSVTRASFTKFRVGFLEISSQSKTTDLALRLGQQF